MIKTVALDMKINNFILHLCAILAFTFTKVVTAQEEKIYKWFDNHLKFGQIGLYNGTENLTKHKIIDKNHKFYISPDYVNGNLVYNNQLYFGIEMKYDLYEDQLIIRLKKDENLLSLRLITEKVQSFEIHGKKIIQLKNEGVFFGFFEILYKDRDISILKKYKKTRKEYSDEKILYSKFNIANEYFILSKNKDLETASKSNLKKLFPKKTKKINFYYKNKKNLKKIDFDSFLIQLIKNLKSPIKNK